MRWGGHRLGRLSPVPYSFNRKTRLFALVAGILIHSMALVGEFGFGAEQVLSVEPTELFASDTSSFPIIYATCNGSTMLVYEFEKTSVKTITERLNSPESCEKKYSEFQRTNINYYQDARKELLGNSHVVSSEVTENTDVDWLESKCSVDKGGVIRLNFTVPESKFRKYKNRTIDLPLERVTTTFHIRYECISHRDRNAHTGLWSPNSYENVSNLHHTILDPYLVLKQNKTFTCLSEPGLNGFFCFSNRTSSVRKLYYSQDGTYGLRKRHLETIYLFAEFDPPVELSRIYFILFALGEYSPMKPESGKPTDSIAREYRDIGSALTLLAAMTEVLAPAGREVNSITGRRIVATIDTEGFVYLSLLCSATLASLLIAVIYIYKATKDSRGRVVKVKSEPQYVIDLVANDILGNEDGAMPVLSDFGIALTFHGRGHHVCIAREGVPYKGGIVAGRLKNAYIPSGKQ